MILLAQMKFWPQGILAWLLITISLLMMLVILVQKGRGGGLSGAFGGGGGSSSAFGAKTGDVFTWITVALAAVFVLVTVVANFAFDVAPPVSPSPPPGAPVILPIEVPAEDTSETSPAGETGSPSSARPTTGAVAPPESTLPSGTDEGAVSPGDAGSSSTETSEPSGSAG